MLAKIEDFLFELNKNDIGTIQHRLSFGWNRQERIGNHQKTQSKGKWEEEITFNGKLLLRSVSALKEFEDMAKEKKPVRLTFGTGESFEITIEELSRTKSGFLKGGEHRFQEYNINMQRYFE